MLAKQDAPGHEVLHLGRRPVEIRDDESRPEDGEPEAAAPSSNASGQPRELTVTVRSVMIAAGVILASAVLGIGGYLVGKGTGEDMDAARSEGQAAGKKAGTSKGTARGFKVGFKRGKEKGYERAFAPAFKNGYVKAFEDAGLAAPKKKEIEVPQ